MPKTQMKQFKGLSARRFLRAAELQVDRPDRKGGACCQLWDTFPQLMGRLSDEDRRKFNKHQEALESMFLPGSNTFSLYWMWSISWPDEVNHESRILALLLCAEFTRDANRRTRK